MGARNILDQHPHGINREEFIEAVARIVPLHVALRYSKNQNILLAKRSVAARSISMLGDGVRIDGDMLFPVQKKSSSKIIEELSRDFQGCNWRLSEEQMKALAAKHSIKPDTVRQYCYRIRAKHQRN